MGVYMGSLKNIGINISSRTGQFCSSRQKTELVGSEELKPIVNEPMSVVRNHPALSCLSASDHCVSRVGTTEVLD